MTPGIRRPGRRHAQQRGRSGLGSVHRCPLSVARRSEIVPQQQIPVVTVRDRSPNWQSVAIRLIDSARALGLGYIAYLHIESHHHLYETLVASLLQTVSRM
jgi:hypothetical protein